MRYECLLRNGLHGFSVDDWADQFFVAAHGEKRYQEELGHRICLADPFSDGTDILQWLRRIQ